MKLAFKRFFLVYLATYFLVGNLGISFTQSTCLFTGIKKYSLDKAISCCSKNTKTQSNQGNTSLLGRAKCCSYDQYALKFNFDQTGNKIQKHDLAGAVLTFPSFDFLGMDWVKSISKIKFLSFESFTPSIKYPLSELTSISHLIF